MKLYSSLSIQGRVTLWATIIVLFGVAVLSAAGISVLRSDLRQAAFAAQGALVGSVAEDLDEKLLLRKQAVLTVAQTINAELLPEPAALRADFSHRKLFQSLFDIVVITDAKGRVITEWPVRPNEGAISVADRAYFQKAMRTGEVVISEPLANKMTGEPTLVFAAPIRDAHGRVAGALLGSLILTRDNFLASLRETRVGRGGYFYLASKGETPRFVLHHDVKRIMSPVPPASVSQPLHQALAGFEGTIEGVNSQGLKALYTFKSLTSVPWVLCGAYPTAEAYAPIESRSDQLLVGAVVFAGLGGLLMGAVTRRQLRPLVQLKRELQAATQGNDQPLPLQSGPKDLRELAEVYNAVRLHKQQAESAQLDIQRRLRAVLEHAGDAFVSIDANGGITEWNQEAEETFGWPRAHVLGLPLDQVLIPAEHRHAHNRGFSHFLGSGMGPVIGQRIEVMALHRTGRLIPVELSVSALKEGGQWIAHAFMRDISDRKAWEEKLAASERHLRDIMDNMPAEIAVMDRQGRFVSVNTHRARTLGLPERALLGAAARDFLDKEERQVIEPWFRQALAGHAVQFETTRKRDGKRHQLHYFIPDKGPAGEVCGVYEMTLDITDRKEAEQLLATNQAQLRAITNNLPVLIAYIDTAGIYRFCNATFEQWFGRPVADIVNRPLDALLGDETWTRKLRSALCGERVEFTTQLQHGDTHRHVMALYIPDLGASGEVHGVHALTFDITQSKVYEQQLLELARHDSLTGLPNRRYFEEKLDEAMARARRSGRAMALLYLDLDRFKHINDTRGHGVGDDLLKGFAQRLVASVRTTDAVCRLAGDEFTVILEGLHHEDEATLVAGKIERAMEEPMQVQDGVVQTSTSIGVAVFSGGAGTGAALLDKADQALYAAKRAGRATFHVTTF